MLHSFLNITEIFFFKLFILRRNNPRIKHIAGKLIFLSKANAHHVPSLGQFKSGKVHPVELITFQFIPSISYANPHKNNFSFRQTQNGH